MNHSGTLYVVATPIGNLQDITLRALETLKSADVIAAEDTRHTSQLLNHFGIKTRLMAVHEHNERAAGEKILALLAEGLSVALVSDAGTPAVSDPGAVAVDIVRAAGYRVMPIPGASAAITALSAAGNLSPHFLFYGFLPTKSSQRRQALESLRNHPYSLIFYEAPHRIVESTVDMLGVFGADRQITFGRELTKTFETIHRCLLGEALAWLESDSNNQRGEFVVIVEAVPIAEEQAIEPDTQRTLELLLAELPLKQAVKLAADITGAKKNALYELALTLKSN
ncbi:16S rRNA (cytidine1402-2'-O)-methyltransferase [Novimethylophilus kurashikiensis]|uniref:Ribosomal RNA small subunit methyltransferase I n=1 Tax=Novimethylophilus kurashikiensis TaxID=1825523 RepID=A0A2R5F9Q6_9PROT|nr:16S rRNA (cytidine(1402)-2'-O)-methyltransferase [Novimethylophilus kurashikiensis]GBG13374.1 16S rRNA (cytidine1402-2'-O)-methyltransferase [Novimethylophilus kurashikiensis]